MLTNIPATQTKAPSSTAAQSTPKTTSPAASAAQTTVIPVSPQSDPIPFTPPQLSFSSIKAQPIHALAPRQAQDQFHALLIDVLVSQIESISHLIKAIEEITKNTDGQMRLICKWMDPDIDSVNHTSCLLPILVKGGPEILDTLYEAIEPLCDKLQNCVSALSDNDEVNIQQQLAELVGIFYTMHPQLLEKINAQMSGLAKQNEEAAKLHITHIPLLTEIQKTLDKLLSTYSCQNA
jgi:hypothetical protein